MATVFGSREIYTNVRMSLEGHPEARAFLWLTKMDVLYEFIPPWQDGQIIFEGELELMTFTTGIAGTCMLFAHSFRLSSVG